MQRFQRTSLMFGYHSRMSSGFVTRFAPSPTGQLHLGNARTAFLSYLAARSSGGRFILRIEDTDEARHDERFVAALLEDLVWLGIDWDEGPDKGGTHSPYRQSARAGVYSDWFQRLEAKGLTYPCYCTPVELSVARRTQLAAGQPPRYAGTCRELTDAARAEREAKGLAASLRFRVLPGRVVEFTDAVHGEQRFATEDIGDFIIRRADGSAAFFFSNALDDALMGVNLVLRGDDHLANTPRQLLLLEAFGFSAPRYAHVGLLLGMDGVPLSKRHGHTSLKDFRDRGYLPEALANHLLRLGHTSAHEGWLDPAEMPANFSLDRLGRAAARFDEAQLRHWQREAIARISDAELATWLEPFAPAGIDAQRLAAFHRVVRPNLEFPDDVVPWIDVVFGELKQFSPEAAAAIAEAGADFFLAARQVHQQAGNDLKPLAKELSAATGRKGPALYMPLRAALSGATHGPELGPLLGLLSPALVQDRFSRAARA